MNATSHQLIEQLRMSSGSNKDYELIFTNIRKGVDQEKVSSNVTFSMSFPISDQGMI